MPDPITATAIGSVPVIIAAVAAIKITARPSRRLLPLTAVACGIALNVFGAAIAGDPPLPAVALGIVAGLAAAGLYDQRAIVTSNRR